MESSLSCQNSLQNSTLARRMTWDIFLARRSASMMYLVLLITDMAALPIWLEKLVCVETTVVVVVVETVPFDDEEIEGVLGVTAMRLLAATAMDGVDADEGEEARGGDPDPDGCGGSGDGANISNPSL